MTDSVRELTDRWQLLCSYDPDSDEKIRPLRYTPDVRVQRFEYSGGNMIYKGTHETLGAATSDTNWRITKYTWDVNDDPVLIEGPVIGSWDDRVSLGWE